MSPLRFFRRARWHRERAAELDAYLEAEAAAQRERGLPADAARRAAERKLGNRTRVLEEIYEANSIAALETLAQDARIAARGLRHAPGLCLAAIGILALGIGANAAMFSVVYAELRPLPYPHPERLVAALESSPQFPRMGVAFPDYLDWRAHNRAFAELAAERGSNMILTHLGPPVMVPGMRVTANMFRTLGVAPALGRGFTAAEDRPGGPDVVVVSDPFWRQRLGADPSVLGRTLDLDGRARTLVGIMPPGFPGLAPQQSAAQFWTPLGAYAGEDPNFMNRGNHAGILVLGRLRDPLTLAAARADLDELTAALALEHPQTGAGMTATVQSYLDLVVGDTRPALLLLLAAAGLVLLIACANVASLLLARTASRQSALALRAALGASRARLIREHLLEALGLGLAGCAFGLPLCGLLLRAAPALLPTPLPRAFAPRLSAPALAFAVAAALLTSLICGLAPALDAGRLPLAQVLKDGGPLLGRGRQRLRSALVVIEMALALVLLLGAGLAMAGLARAQRVPIGLEPHGVLAFIAGLPPTRYPRPAQQSEFFRQALAAFDRLPGVTRTGGVFPLPFGGNDWEEAYLIAGRPEPAANDAPAANVAVVRGRYFDALGIARLRGRDFTPADDATAPPVAIVDADFAARNWPRQPPETALGHRVNLDGTLRTIVGVVAPVRGFDAGATAPEGEIYIPQEQSPLNTGVLSFVLKSGATDANALRPAALAALAQVDADQPVTDVGTMDELLAAALAARAHARSLMALFALLALALAATGVYGVMACTVAQRRHEIGIRMALGAGRGTVLRMVLGQGLRLAALGALIGWIATLPLSRLAAAFLPGLQWNDPTALAAIPILLLAVAALACYLPARRATRVDPTIALRRS